MSAHLVQFLKSAANQVKSGSLRDLFEQLAARAEKLNEMHKELEATIIRNREARTGEKFQFTDKQKRTLKNFEVDAQQAAKEQVERVARLGDLNLLNAVIKSEQQALELEQQLYKTFRPKDRESANRILEFRRETLTFIREYIEHSEAKNRVDQQSEESR